MSYDRAEKIVKSVMEILGDDTAWNLKMEVDKLQVAKLKIWIESRLSYYRRRCESQTHKNLSHIPD